MTSFYRKKAPLHSGAFSYALTFLAEVGETQTCGRLILSLLAQRSGNQNQNGHQIGEHLEQLDVLAAQTGDDHVDPEQQAEQVGTPDGVEGAPGGEDNQCHGQPAQGFNGAVIAPGSLDIVHGVVQTAQTGDAGADAGGQILIAGDVDAGSVGGAGVLAHCPEVQTHTGLCQHDRSRNGNGDSCIGEEIVGKE